MSLKDDDHPNILIRGILDVNLLKYVIETPLRPRELGLCQIWYVTIYEMQISWKELPTLLFFNELIIQKFFCYGPDL